MILSLALAHLLHYVVCYLPDLRELESRSNKRPFGDDEECGISRAWLHKLDDSALVACVRVLDVRLARTARVGKRIDALMQRAYSVFSGHTRILGCTDYAETENCYVHPFHLCAGTGSRGIERTGGAKVVPEAEEQLKR